jgi:hypothetical protein
MENIEFVVDPALIAIGGLLVPVLTELVTKSAAASKYKQHVATIMVAVIIAGSLVLELTVRHTLSIHGTVDVLGLIPLVIAQTAVVRAAVEGGHRFLDAGQAGPRPLAKVLQLAPKRGFGKVDPDKKAA